jgi:putative oxidoreductase
LFVASQADKETFMSRFTEASARLRDPAYAALRAVAGALFAVHGMQKLFGWAGSTFQPPVGSQLWLGAIIELSCGLLIALGLFTRAAAFLASGTMAVAYLQFHWQLKLADYLWIPQVNKGELALLYCFLFLFIMTQGPGSASLDRRRA